MSKVAILECGAQYTKVIDRRIREREVCSEVFPLNVPAEQLQGYQGIIISGGPHSVYDQKIGYDPAIFDLGIPVLGICYGMQLINQHFGGRVESLASKEYGETDISVNSDALLFKDLAEVQTVLMSHGDSVQELPEGFEVIARSENCIAGICDRSNLIYGLQFHPEVDLTINGGTIFDNFLFEVCQCDRTFTLAQRLEDACERVKEQVGDRKVMILVSGGVDSCVSYGILNRALQPEQVIALHIDNGFMRQDESAQVIQALEKLGYHNLEFIDATESFRNATMIFDGEEIGSLWQVADPEHKRMLIGHHFYEIVRDFITEQGLDLAETFIAQGTLRPDLIESGNPEVSEFANRIKTHHNDVDIIREQRKKNLIVETNRDLHKDEVRKLAIELGLPEEIAYRQPFPGPGLAVRIMNQDQLPGAEWQAEAEAVHAQLDELGIPAKLTPVKTVGVQGDHRSYRNLLLLYADDLYDWAKVRSHAKLLVDRFAAVNRAAVVVTDHQPEQEVKSFTFDMDHQAVRLCQEFDAEIRNICEKYDLIRRTDQILAVLVPLHTTPERRFSVGLRVFMTNDYMTGSPASLGEVIPRECIAEIKAYVEGHSELDMLLYDVTSKPPATTEWQ